MIIFTVNNISKTSLPTRIHCLARSRVILTASILRIPETFGLLMLLLSLWMSSTDSMSVSKCGKSPFLIQILCNTHAVTVISTHLSNFAVMFCSRRNLFCKSPNDCSTQTRVVDNFLLLSVCEGVNCPPRCLYGTNSHGWRAKAESPMMWYFSQSKL